MRQQWCWGKPITTTCNQSNGGKARIEENTIDNGSEHRDSRKFSAPYSSDLWETLSPTCNPETESGRERPDGVDGEAADRAGEHLSVLMREGDLKEKLCYVALDYEGEMGKALKIIEQCMIFQTGMWLRSRARGFRRCCSTLRRDGGRLNHEMRHWREEGVAREHWTLWENDVVSWDGRDTGQGDLSSSTWLMSWLHPMSGSTQYGSEDRF